MRGSFVLYRGHGFAEFKLVKYRRYACLVGYFRHAEENSS